ncbi:hypothetical protein MFU01_25320 [Myxococcus fulvus]|uniref:Uncharacterized protein n=1 Tax=Myxococcus fulvus TaxID=33 RepID=A0A511T030_MYXFU|nr:hypothetical protein MFU01_25320 [Myxococcus fulvus]
MAASSDSDVGCLIGLGITLGILYFAGVGVYRTYQDHKPKPVAAPAPAPPDLSPLEKCLKGDLPSQMQPSDVRLLRAARTAFGVEIAALNEEQLVQAEVLAEQLEQADARLSTALPVVQGHWEQRQEKVRLLRQVLEATCRSALRRAKYPVYEPAAAAQADE